MSYNPNPYSQPPQPPAPDQNYSGYTPPPPTAPDLPSPPISAEKPARLPGPTVATVCFLIVVVLFNVLSVVLVKVFNLSSIAVTSIGEVLLVAGIPLLFWRLRGYDFKQTFSARPLGFEMLALCALTGLAAQFAVRLPSLLSNWLLQVFGPLYVPDLDDGTAFGKWLTLLALIILAPLCEETLNRGFVMAGYRRLGFWRCVLIVGIFFGFFHQYPYRFLDTMIAGMLLAYLALTTNSILASMAAHFGFNLFPAIVNFFRDDLLRYVNERSRTQFSNSEILLITPDQVIAGVVLSLFGSALVFLLLRVITRRAAAARPGIVVSYIGLVKEIVEGATTYENGAYYGPANQPYRYGPLGYVPAAAPAPRRLSDAATRPRLKVVTPGWTVTVLLLLALFAYTSFTEIALRARGQVYCRDNPSSCQPLTQTAPPSGPFIVTFLNK